MKSTHDPGHPGEILRERFPAGMALNDIARHLGVSRQTLSALVNGRAGISAPMALRLEAALGMSAEKWLAMQTHYDLRQARKSLPEIQETVAALPAAADATPESQATIPPLVDQHRGAIAKLCERHGVRELWLFGSVLREDFDPLSSDLDAAVSFGPPRGESLARQYFDFKREFEELLARQVDLVEIEAMPNTRLRRIIERTKVPLYAAAA